MVKMRVAHSVILVDFLDFESIFQRAMCTCWGSSVGGLYFRWALTLDVSMDCLLLISGFGISQSGCFAAFYILTASNIHDVI